MERLPDTTGTLEWAQKYARLGWPLLPVVGKRPALRNWQMFEANPVNLRYWFGTRECNVGLRTGESGYVVVDTDTPAAEEWVIDHLPDTPMRAKSGNGSRHRYYAAPKTEIRNKQAWHGIKGLDIRGHGGFIVLPGSLHPETGRLYEWTGEISDPRGLPAFSPRWVSERRKVIHTAIADVVNPDGLLDRARAYLATIEPAVSGQGGHTKTLTTALKLARFVNHDPELLWLLLTEYNARCQPPWGEKELRHKHAEALRLAR